MALTVCCPCGNPIDCENLDIVVTLQCGQCGVEITLEIDNDNIKRSRAVLTVMEGPYWVGERFVIPVEQDLVLGRKAEIWLSLEGVANEHCRLHLGEDGRLQIDDLPESTGTWIDEQRIANGRLDPGQSFRIGDYRFRLDFETAGGQAPIIIFGEEENLPELDRIETQAPLAEGLVRNRYRVIRATLLTYAWLSALFHVLILRSEMGWAWWQAILVGAAILAALVPSAHRVTLTHPYLKYVAPAGLLLLAIIDVAVWKRPVAASTGFVLSGTVPLLTAWTPSREAAVTTAVLAFLSVAAMAVITLIVAVGFQA